MFRRLLSIVPALFLTVALAGSAAAAGRLSPQQKAAATKDYKKLAQKQFGPGVGVKVKYSGKTDRDARVTVHGTGGITGTQQNALLGIGTGRVVVHRKPALVKKDGKVKANLDGGRYQMIFSILPVPGPAQTE